MRKQHWNFSSSQVILLGFAAVILLGSLLLMLPISTQDGQGAPFSDALFTATSAVCVTGLVIQDTALYWSLFGQSIILLLIQSGGMGVISIIKAASHYEGETDFSVQNGMFITRILLNLI